MEDVKCKREDGQGASLNNNKINSDQ